MTLWKGRFSGELDQLAFALNTSLPFDQRLSRQDVEGSMAWAGALAQAGVLTQTEAEAMTSGLELVMDEFARDKFIFSGGDEDIHTAVERRLGELIGPLAGKLHTGRSRNDQVATDFRMWMLEMLPQLDAAINGLQKVLVSLAEEHVHTLMPGYTHLQRAQPITLGHWLLSHVWPLQRDRERLEALRNRTAVLPLGCGALAGTGFPVDRDALADALGFDGPAPNSLDAVSDRDFAAEFLFCAAMIGTHLSKLAESMILFTTAEFGFITLDDAYSTGSSLMPQKKNPDMFELARGKAGKLTGLLTGLMTTLKGLPSTYDKDLQEDKEPVFQATDTLMALLPVLGGAMQTMTVNKEKMLAAIDPFMMATDVADYLVKKGVPFREAHSITGSAVRAAVEKGVPLDQLSLDEWQDCGPFDTDIFAVFDPKKSIQSKSAIGGTSPQAVEQQIKKIKELV